MAARRRWVVIVFGVGILLVFVGIGAIIAVTAWFQQNLEVRTLGAAEAESEFEVIRKQFGDRAPLLEMRDGRPHYSGTGTGEGAPAAKSDGTRLETLHVLVWDPHDDRLARFSLPFWLLRMKSDPIRFSAFASGMDDGRVNLRPEDIERYGPGVILDTGKSTGERVLLWAQ